jgi:predicted XRE-type DNA-binding protein
MAKSHEEVMASLPARRRERIKARAKELIEEEMTLRDLRSVQQLTQERVAELLGIEQDSVSRMERRADMLLSTMSSYVEAMGGRLRLIAEFPNRQPYSVKLSDLTAKPVAAKRRKTGKAA